MKIKEKNGYYLSTIEKVENGRYLSITVKAENGRHLSITDTSRKLSLFIYSRYKQKTVVIYL